MGSGFRAWKLHTVGDYLFFILLIVGFVVFLKLATRWLRSRRTREIAIRRVEKKLRRLGGKGSFCLRDGWIETGRGDRQFDLIWFARDSVRAVKVCHFGLEVSGDIEGDHWRFSDRLEHRWLPNPMPDLNLIKNSIGRALVAAGVRGAKAETMIVFADNFGTTRNIVSGSKDAISLIYLKRWRRDHPISKEVGSQLDIEAASSAVAPLLRSAPDPKESDSVGEGSVDERTA